MTDWSQQAASQTSATWPLGQKKGTQDHFLMERNGPPDHFLEKKKGPPSRSVKKMTLSCVHAMRIRNDLAKHCLDRENTQGPPENAANCDKRPKLKSAGNTIHTRTLLKPPGDTQTSKTFENNALCHHRKRRRTHQGQPGQHLCPDVDPRLHPDTRSTLHDLTSGPFPSADDRTRSY